MMMRHHLLVVLASAALVGCAATPTGVMALMQTGDLRVEVPEGGGYDYRVSLKNGRDCGYDGDNPADRLKVVRIALAKECADVSVAEESAIKGIVTPFGFAQLVYVMKVKCRRG
jgi:hypothetical protein